MVRCKPAEIVGRGVILRDLTLPHVIGTLCRLSVSFVERLCPGPMKLPKVSAFSDTPSRWMKGVSSSSLNSYVVAQAMRTRTLLRVLLTRHRMLSILVIHRLTPSAFLMPSRVRRSGLMSRKFGSLAVTLICASPLPYTRVSRG